LREIPHSQNCIVKHKRKIILSNLNITFFNELEKINQKPEPFQFYTADGLWTDPHTSEQMLKYHLNENVDISSRNSDFIKRSLEWIISKFNVNADTKIADFGCGPGLYTLPLANAKAQVTGIDFSNTSIQYAIKAVAEKNLTIEYINQNYLEYQTDQRFDLIIMIMCDFCALSPDQRKTMLDKFHELLAPGGAVLLDVYSLNAFDAKQEAAICQANQLDGFWSPEKYYGFVNTFKYEEQKVILDKYTIIEANRTRTIYNWLQYFSSESLEQEFTNAGFVAEKFYADVAGSTFDPNADEFAVIAKKKNK